MKNRKLLIGILLLLPAVAILWVVEGRLQRYIADAYLVLILVMIHVLMPKSAGLTPDHPKVRTLRKYNILMGVSLFALRMMHLLLPEGNGKEDNQWILPFAVIVILLVGNAAPKLPINHVVGVRMPWTMQDEDTWRMTHRVMGYCSFPVALITMAGGLLVDRVCFSVCGLLAFGLIPCAYSYIYHRSKK